MRKFNSILVFVFIFVGPVVSLSAANSLADVVIIANPKREKELRVDEIRKLYLGILKPINVEILDQAEDQMVREEFYLKFLDLKASSIKRKRSILIFSGEKVPLVLANDLAVFEHVKKHFNAIGYVSKEFLDTESKKKGDGAPIAVYTIK